MPMIPGQPMGPPPMMPPMGGMPPGPHDMGGGEMMMGPPPGPPPGPPQGTEISDRLRAMIEEGQAAIQEEPDDVDSEKIAAILKALYSILANRQKEQESLMGGSNMRALSRAQNG